MNNIAQLSKTDRNELFQLTAEHMNFHPVNIEKDFWVCWLLNQLFSIKELESGSATIESLRDTVEQTFEQAERANAIIPSRSPITNRGGKRTT